jgi:hypothetical protein
MNYLANTKVVARRMTVALVVTFVPMGCIQAPGTPYGSTPSGSPATLGTSPSPAGGYPSTIGAASNPFNSISSLFGPSAASGRPIGTTSSTANAVSNPLGSLSSLFGVSTASGGTIPPELTGLFLNAPYNPNASMDDQYPRIAFTVLTSPPNHAQLITIIRVGGGVVPPACWQLSARIWSSADKSKDVAPFSLCMPDILSGVRGVPLRGWEDWVLMSTYRPPDGQTTGERRTLGPIPPDSIYPQGVRYQPYYYNLKEFPAGDSEEGTMWAALLYGMGFDWEKLQDRRIWIYKYVAVEG